MRILNALWLKINSRKQEVNVISNSLQNKACGACSYRTFIFLLYIFQQASSLSFSFYTSRIIVWIYADMQSIGILVFHLDRLT